jgi:predicted enzyme related to lactoylglutathione lyase
VIHFEISDEDVGPSKGLYSKVIGWDFKDLGEPTGLQAGDRESK